MCHLVLNRLRLLLETQATLTTFNGRCLRSMSEGRRGRRKEEQEGREGEDHRVLQTMSADLVSLWWWLCQLRLSLLAQLQLSQLNLKDKGGIGWDTS